MIYSRMIGAVRATNLIEYIGPTHDPKYLYPDMTEDELAANVGWLSPHQYVPHMSRFIVAMQIWVIHAGDSVIIIDTGVGNAKPRPAVPRMHQLNTLTLQWLAAAGAAPEQVTHVINTHFHGDHVGWNTTLVDGRWSPTFPNARYYFSKADFDAHRAAYAGGNRTTLSGGFEDSVLPIVEAGLAELVDEDTQYIDCLRVEHAPGHTPGQFTLRVSSKGQEGILCADIMHTPVQIALPHVNTVVDMIPELARATRAEFLERAARRNALIMPCHFGFPHCGYVRGSDQGGYSFEPEPVLNRLNDNEFYSIGKN
ncbi:MBL fold metallo-hydrolase [Aminobacter sp. MSH1]|uniref:MBL fold metallo-hydrolase n=1 Tax=Aminobacter sp. MSH1 TaxID=374606 RepID=UPI000D3D3FBD|nr:MBL fold metallo-hydrolase [Aminobacter sp. MSH1]